MSDQTPDPSTTGATPAGWYPDPQNPGRQRYWDGSAWTPAAPGTAPIAGPPTSTNAVIALVLAIVSWVICPIIAAIVALVLARSSSKEIAASGGSIGGAGLNTATRIIAWINIGVSIVAGLVFAGLAIFGVIFTANVASTLDPATNAKTGLTDGPYVMNPERWVSINSECTYGGPAYRPEQTEAGDVTVYGKGPIECPDLGEIVAVYFEVEGGVARIVDVN
jgi:hypothetical protein